MAERAEVNFDDSGRATVTYTIEVEASDKSKVSEDGSYLAYDPERPDLFLAHFSAMSGEHQAQVIKNQNYGANLYSRAATRAKANAKAEGPEKALARASKALEGLSPELLEALLAKLASK